MFVTWLDSNSWLWEMGGTRILVDPWIVGSLMFGNQSWLFKGDHPRPRPIPDNVDLILLTQGLPDHAHRPTLEQLDRSIPVVCSPNGAKAIADLGYHSVTALDHGQTHTLPGRIEIKAVPGSPVGPALLENGYIVREQNTGLSLFYEPHGFHQPSLREDAPIDVLVTPILDLRLPVVGPIIRGQKGALELTDWLDPQVILPTADAGEVEYSGLLVSLLRADGGAAALTAELNQRGSQAQLLQPQVDQRLELPLKQRVTLAP